MNRFTISVSATMLLLAPAFAVGDALPAAVVKDLKSAAALVVVKSPGGAVWRSSGVVFHREGETTYVATVLPFFARMAGDARTAPSVVVNVGTPREQTAPAQLHSFFLESNLAVLKVRDLKDPPRPIDFAVRGTATETHWAFAAGFSSDGSFPGQRIDNRPTLLVTAARIAGVKADEPKVVLDRPLLAGMAGSLMVDADGRPLGLWAHVTGPTNFSHAISLPDVKTLLTAKPIATVPTPAIKPKIPIAVEPKKESEIRVIDGHTVREIKPGVKDLTSISWTLDGKSYAVLDGKSGLVKRYSLADHNEQASLEIERECTGLATSKEGFVVTVSQAQEVWVLDPATLKPLRKIACGGAWQTAVGSRTSIAVNLNQDRDRLSLLDLAKGELGNQFSANDLNAGVANPRLSPDGKTLYTSGGFEQIHRFGIDGGSITLQQTSARLLQGPATVVVSEDGAYVCGPSGGGNYRLDDEAKIPSYSVYVFRSENLTKPAFFVNQGAYPRTMAIDPAAKRVYAQNYDKQLIVFDMNGTKLHELKLTAGETRAFVVHPDGRRLFVVVGTKAFLVDRP